MGGKGSAPAPPDYSGIAAASSHAADLQYSLGQDQLAWAKQQYAQDSSVVNKVVDQFMSTQSANDANAASDRARYQNEYQPLEDQLIADANSYASPERKDLEMGRAEGAVTQQFDQARNNAQRQLEDFGINPSSTRYAALDIGSRAQEAATTAAAGNQASQMVDATGRALRSEAINVGRGYPGQIAGTYNTSLQAGSSAINGTLANTATGAQTMGTPTQWFAGANNSLGTWSNALTSGYNAELAQFNANQNTSSGFGTALGAGLGLMGSIAKLSAGGEVPPGGALPTTGIPMSMQDNPGSIVPPSASPSGGRAVDDVPARLTPGEFVIPKDVVAWEGEKSLQNLITKARTAKQGAQARPQVGIAPRQAPTFNSRAPQRALPVPA